MSELPNCKLCGADAVLCTIQEGEIAGCSNVLSCRLNGIQFTPDEWCTLMTKHAGEKVYLVPTGQISEGGLELHERHDAPVPMADFEVLYTAPQAQPAPTNKEHPNERD